MRLMYLVALLSAAFLVVSFSGASTYVVTNINTTVNVNTNGSAYVSEILTIRLSNFTIQQYAIQRSSLNLTLNDWQSLVGPDLEPHIINPQRGIYSFELLPGPVYYNDAVPMASIYLDYYVGNVVTVNQTGPRTFLYTFNQNVLNFQQGGSGSVLGKGMRLNVVLPEESSLVSVYPLPDYESDNQTNLNSSTVLSWYRTEPLYDFSLSFTARTSLSSEVLDFFGSIYGTLGIFVYVIIGLAVLLFVIYTYFRTGR